MPREQTKTEFLRSEVARLKTLLGSAENAGSAADGWGLQDYCCPWCLEHIGELPKGERNHRDRHHPDCPAFTPEGDVR